MTAVFNLLSIMNLDATPWREPASLASVPRHYRSTPFHVSGFECYSVWPNVNSKRRFSNANRTTRSSFLYKTSGAERTFLLDRAGCAVRGSLFLRSRPSAFHRARRTALCAGRKGNVYERGLDHTTAGRTSLVREACADLLALRYRLLAIR